MPSTNACPGSLKCSTRAAIWTPSLRELAVLGEEVPLVLGLTYYGLYVLKSVEVQHRIFHNGVTMSAEIALNLTEYN